MDKSKKDKEDESAKKAKLFEWDYGGNASNMMKRMNFQKDKGLGTKGKGIKRPIEAVKRPKSMGLGYLGEERRDLYSNTKEEEQNTWDYIYEMGKQEDDLVKKFHEEVAELTSGPSTNISSSSVQPFVTTGERKRTKHPIIKVIIPEASTHEEKESAVEIEEPGPLGSRSVKAFQKLKKINDTVFKAMDQKTKEIVALKQIKQDRSELQFGFPLRALREINLLLQCNHPSIVKLKEVVVGGTQERDVYLVTEYVEQDLKSIMGTKKLPFSTSEVKCLMLQLLDGVNYLHTNWILHRDLKPSNLLLNNRGDLKISDFGMARQYGSSAKPYTQKVISQWYRPPELLLGEKQYSTAVDMWSIGCIMGELLSHKPLFQGKTAINQLEKIFEILGTPSQTIWPGLPNAAKFQNSFRMWVSFAG